VHRPRACALGYTITPLQGSRSSLTVADGIKAKGIETDADIQWRKEFLRKIGYKL